jgi:chromosome segregation ATPase
MQAMSKTTQIDPIDQISERVDRLLLRYEELLRANALLSAEVETLVNERDSLKSRLSAARLRVETLLERLPELAVNTPQRMNE